MTTKKATSKAEVSKAAKTLSTSSSTKAKTAAAKILSQRSVATRLVHAAPKAGTISRATAKKAVKNVVASRTLNKVKK